MGHYHVNVAHILVNTAGVVLAINLGRIAAGLLAKQSNPLAQKAGASLASIL